MTPKQAREARAALGNALQHLVEECEWHHREPRYHFDDDGVCVAPTKWESIALFRLMQDLALRGIDDLDVYLDSAAKP